jgi:hypothetical protein
MWTVLSVNFKSMDRVVHADFMTSAVFKMESRQYSDRCFVVVDRHL